jgi:hypothetical protein
MSIDNNKQYITNDISYSKNEETTIILSLLEEISKIEEKIIELKNSVNAENNNDNKNKEIENLNITKIN